MSTTHRRPARGRQFWPVLVVLATMVVGLTIAVLGPWRIGCLVIGCGLVGGALIRLVLPAREAGLLQVRGKTFDIVVMAVAGIAIGVFSFWVPGR